MAQPILVQEAWSRMVRDVSRDQIGGDSLYNMVDVLPEVGAPGRCRGPWSFFGGSLVSAARSIFWADFTAGAQLVAINNSHELYDVTNSVDRGATTVTAVCKSATFFNNLLIYATSDPAGPAQKYSGSGAPAALAGSPPVGIGYVDSYKGRVIAASASKLYFSAVGNQDSWDTTNAWIQPTYALTGIAALRGAILLFSNGRTERIRGDSPPPALGMVLEPAFDVGCIDARSIAKFDDKVVFANTGGVYMTDGAALTDMTAAGGMKSYWRSLLSGFASGWTIAGGIYKRWYIVSVQNGSSVLQDTLVCDLDTRSWFRLSNVNADSFARSLGASEETYFGIANGTKVGALSGVFAPSLTTLRQDADGTNILPVLETGFLRPRPYSRATRYLPPGTSKRIRRAYISADLRRDTGQATSLSIGRSTDPSVPAYTSIGSLAAIDYLAAGTGMTRVRFDVSQEAQGIAFQLALSGGPIRTFDLYDLELEYRFREASRAR